MKGTTTEAGSNQDMMASLLDQYMDENQYRRGDIVEGMVVNADTKSILVDIGGKSDAKVHPNEVERMDRKRLETLKPGKPVKVYIIDDGGATGQALVSLARAAQEDDWDEARELLESGKKVSLPVVDANKGGVIVKLGRLRGFVPGSQLCPQWRPRYTPNNPDRRWEDLIEETLDLCVIEVTSERNRLILSERKAFEGKDVKHRILENLEIGGVETGIVSNIVSFGAFVNVKGVDGLLHISELSWRRVTNAADVVQVGQEIEVYILDIDLDSERLGLSLKRLQPDPWESVADEFHVGEMVEVEIVNLTSFGAFAALVDKPEIEGLIHVSELSDDKVERPGEIVRVGDRHYVQIISLRPEQRRIAFSLKQAEPPALEEPIEIEEAAGEPTAGEPSAGEPSAGEPEEAIEAAMAAENPTEDSAGTEA
ncbi:MAG: 30S ribosomal protein S1 [Anaerolineales bacterium]